MISFVFHWNVLHIVNCIPCPCMRSGLFLSKCRKSYLQDRTVLLDWNASNEPAIIRKWVIVNTTARCSGPFKCLCTEVTYSEISSKGRTAIFSLFSSPQLFWQAQRRARWSNSRKSSGAKLWQARTPRRSWCWRETKMPSACCRRRRWTTWVVSRHTSTSVRPQTYRHYIVQLKGETLSTV